MTSAQPDSEIATARVEAIAREVTRVRRDGVKTVLVIGAGNIHRGLEAVAEGMDLATGD